LIQKTHVKVSYSFNTFFFNKVIHSIHNILCLLIKKVGFLLSTYRKKKSWFFIIDLSQKKSWFFLQEIKLVIIDWNNELCIWYII